MVVFQGKEERKGYFSGLLVCFRKRFFFQIHGTTENDKKVIWRNMSTVNISINIWIGPTLFHVSRQSPMLLAWSKEIQFMRLPKTSWVEWQASPKLKIYENIHSVNAIGQGSPTLGLQMFLDYNSRKPSPPPLLARISGSWSPRASGGPRLGTTDIGDIWRKWII